MVSFEFPTLFHFLKNLVKVLKKFRARIFPRWVGEHGELLAFLWLESVPATGFFPGVVVVGVGFGVLVGFGGGSAL